MAPQAARTPEWFEQRAEEALGKALVAGAVVNGFPNELWTLARVAQLIEREFGLAYSTVHVWRILRELGFSSQRPAGRALQRDEAAIKTWRTKRTPPLSSRSAKGGTLVFIDESGLSERPTQGSRPGHREEQTPVLQYSFNWKQLSVVAGLSFWNFYFRFHAGAIRGPQFVEFLQALTHQIRGKLLVIWDGLPAHRSRVVKNFVRSARRPHRSRPVAGIRAGAQSGRIHLGIHEAARIGQSVPSHYW